MSGGHVSAGLHHEGDSPLHRLPPEVKIAATVLFVVSVVVTPREAFWAFGLHLALLVAVAVSARLLLSFMARRLRIEVPFVPSPCRSR